MSVQRFTMDERHAIESLKQQAAANRLPYPRAAGKIGEKEFRLAKQTAETLAATQPAEVHKMIVDDGHVIVFTHDQGKDGTWVWHLSISHLIGVKISPIIALMVLHEFGFNAPLESYEVYYGERAIHIEGPLEQ